jgi:hypothetical protein
MYTIRIPRRALKLKFKGKRPMGRPRTWRFNQILKDMKRRGKRWQEIEKNFGIVEEIGDFSSAQSYKTETMEEEAV